MDSNSNRYVEIDGAGRLVLPPDLASRYDVKPGRRVCLAEGPNGLWIQQPSRLAKLYVEPTSRCNLECRTCMRNTWEEPQGFMSQAVFAGIMDGLRAFSPMPTVFFGGLGEPLLHPNITAMVARAKATGASVELITNGTLLTRNLSLELLNAGIDMLWVSLDGASSESYAGLRPQAELTAVLENVSAFRKASVGEEGTISCCSFASTWKTKLGISFVAMKRNIADLPGVIDLGQRLGVDRFLVTNVLPYTREMVDEALYYRALNNGDGQRLRLPEMDADDTTCSSVRRAMRSMYGTWASINHQNARNLCPFVESGSGAIGWDGGLSPCLPLMHSHTSYHGNSQSEKRFSRRWLVGNVADRSLPELWNEPEHLAFRERVQAFSFSPCTNCGGCDLSEKNEEDCYGNTFPTCGGCLWAQGVIQCP